MKYRKSRLKMEMERHRRRFMLKALKRHDWNILKTATALRLFKHIVYDIVKKDPVLRAGFDRAREKKGTRHPWPDPRRSRWSRRNISQK